MTTARVLILVLTNFPKIMKLIEMLDKFGDEVTISTKLERLNKTLDYKEESIEDLNDVFNS